MSNIRRRKIRIWREGDYFYSSISGTDRTAATYNVWYRVVLYNGLRSIRLSRYKY